MGNELLNNSPKILAREEKATTTRVYMGLVFRSHYFLLLLFYTSYFKDVCFDFFFFFSYPAGPGDLSLLR